MTRLFPIVLLTAVLLAGCSQRPDDAAITRAVQQQVRDGLSDIDTLADRLGGDSAVKMLRAFGAPDPDELYVEHLEVLDAQRLDNGDYTMKIHYDLVTPDNSRGMTRTIQLRAVADGWRAVAYDPATNGL